MIRASHLSVGTWGAKQPAPRRMWRGQRAAPPTTTAAAQRRAYPAHGCTCDPKFPRSTYGRRLDGVGYRECDQCLGIELISKGSENARVS
jgi:hypothetical protein